MWKILQIDNPSDFIIGTGVSMSLENFIQIAFEYFDLDWREYVEVSDQLKRPSDIVSGYADSSKAKKILNWEAKLRIKN